MQAGVDADDGAPSDSGAAAGGKCCRPDAQGRVIGLRNQRQVRQSVGLWRKRKRSMLDFFGPLTPSPTTPAAWRRNTGATAWRRNTGATVPRHRAHASAVALRKVSAIDEFPVHWKSEDGKWHVVNKGDLIWDGASDVEGEIVGKVTRGKKMFFCGVENFDHGQNLWAPLNPQ